MNPCNSCCYSGWVTGKVNFYKNAAGIVYQARFTVKVKRDRKTQRGIMNMITSQCGSSARTG